MYVSRYEMRKAAGSSPCGKVTWIIDRNVNTTNVCIANCKFWQLLPGAFGHADAYIILDIDTYKRKIEETFRYGGEQSYSLQGGTSPRSWASLIIPDCSGS